MLITSKKICSQVSMSKNYKFEKNMYNSMEYVTIFLCHHIHMSEIEYLCYLFHIYDLGRENKIDTFFPHLITVSVLVHAGCCYRMPEAGWFINHVICHSSGG